MLNVIKENFYEAGEVSVVATALVEIDVYAAI